MLDERKVKHLEMIESVINRMAACSFHVKSQSVIFVLAIFAFANRPDGWLLILSAYIPAIVFWGLDAFYLFEERRFRALYEDVRMKAENDIDFSMRRDHLQSKARGVVGAMFSKTLLPFYGSIILVTTLLVAIVATNSSAGGSLSLYIKW